MPKHIALAALSEGHFDGIEVKTPTAGSVASCSKLFGPHRWGDDWPMILGFTASGTVVQGLAVDDRIPAFSLHVFDSKNLQGTTQEYIALPEDVCAKVPDNIVLDVAATIPDNFITAFFSFFDQLALPHGYAATESQRADSHLRRRRNPGQMHSCFCARSGIRTSLRPTPPRQHAFLRAPGAAHTLDYASPTLSADAVAAAGGKFAYALDSITADNTIAKIAPLVRAGDGKVALLLPIKVGGTVAVGNAGVRWEVEANTFAEGVEIAHIKVFAYRENTYLMTKILPQLLEPGHVQPNRVGLDQGTFKERVAMGLELLMNNKVSGEKIIVKVA